MHVSISKFQILLMRHMNDQVFFLDLYILKASLT